MQDTTIRCLWNYEIANSIFIDQLGKQLGHAILLGENVEGDSSCTSFINIEDIHADFVNATCSQFLSHEESWPKKNYLCTRQN